MHSRNTLNCSTTQSPCCSTRHDPSQRAKVWEDIVPPTEQRDGDAWIRIIKFHEIPRPNASVSNHVVRVNTRGKRTAHGHAGPTQRSKSQPSGASARIKLGRCALWSLFRRMRQPPSSMPLRSIPGGQRLLFRHYHLPAGRIWQFSLLFRQFPAIYDGETPSLEKLEQRQKRC